MDYKTLKTLKPSEFSDAADGYRTTGDMAAEAKDRLDNQIAVAMRKAQAGEAAEAAFDQLRLLSENFHYTQVECGVVSTALKGFSYDLEAAKKKLDVAVEGARAERLTVNSDGSVSYPPGGEKADGKLPEGGTVSGLTDSTASAVGRQAANFDPNPHYRRAQEYADQIANALKEAAEADEKWAPKLRALKADDDLTVSERDWADAKKDTGGVLKAAERYLETIKDPPKDGDAEDNAQWWEDLTPEQRADYLAVHPGIVGALDGLPSDIRDEANRTVLSETRAKYQLELSSIPPEPVSVVTDAVGHPIAANQEWVEWNERYGDKQTLLEQRLKGMDAIQSRFDATGRDGLPEAYLLGFDPVGRGDGKVILANGNPDTADHTAIYVPGTGTDLEGISGDLSRGDNLWKESHVQAPDQKISTITWFDYDAPRSAYPTDKGDLVPEASNDKYAAEGGPVLREFLDGNRIAHQSASGPNNFAHTTLIGHSYGSTLIGDAAKSGGWPDGPLPVDDVLVAGSPGMQADRAADLGIPKGHMWAMGASFFDDQVPDGGRLVGLGDNGVVPTDPEFGANIMETDSTSHSGYWDMGGNGNASVSLKNQARVIVGDYEGVTLE
ncbi:MULTISPECIES: alpha/beta hydrolase [unclassified Streptomyces]|uniref:alpha/beta hydrolase n=1 Tax=unclassified Streptomyces TaxID=2593676 RepID=UPI0037F97B56